MIVLFISMSEGQAPNYPIRNALKEVFGENNVGEIEWQPLLAERGKEYLRKRIIEANNAWGPDITFFHTQYEGLIDYKTLKQLKGFKVQWTGDVRHDIGWYKEISQFYDCTLFSNYTDVKKCNSKGIANVDYLQVGFDEKLYVPRTEIRDSSVPEIVFIGNNYSNNCFPLSKLRLEIVTKLKECYGDKFGIYGSGWSSIDPKIKFVNNEEEARIYQNCKIAINLSHFDYELYSSDRMFRMMGAGALCLSHKFQRIDEMFTDGVHLRTWETFEGLRSWIDYYLERDNANELNDIAIKGSIYVHKHYTWQERFKDLINIKSKMEKLKSKNDLWAHSFAQVHKLKRYSQTGEEGIIGHILNNIGVDKFLVDIGAWDGTHLSNTKLFLDEYGYKGLLIDGDNRGNKNVKEEFITAENVCDVLAKYDCPKEFDFLSFDLDGNDYYIIKALCKEYRPRLICAEFNGTIDKGVSKTIKYNPSHTWGNDDYYGFSFEAAKKLADEIGYKIVWTNDSLNIYLVRKDCFVNPNIEINLDYTPNKYHAHNPNGEWVNV